MSGTKEDYSFENGVSVFVQDIDGGYISVVCEFLMEEIDEGVLTLKEWEEGGRDELVALLPKLEKAKGYDEVHVVFNEWVKAGNE